MRGTKKTISKASSLPLAKNKITLKRTNPKIRNKYGLLDNPITANNRNRLNKGFPILSSRNKNLLKNNVYVGKIK